MELNKALIDELLKNTKSPEDLLGKNGLLKQLTKHLVEAGGSPLCSMRS